MSLLSVPQSLWTYYVEYLWNYQPHSTVAKIGYTFRALALVLLLPIMILILIDIASYTIARTLGVVDVVKASTSDKQTVHAIREPPLIHIHEASLEQAHTTESNNAFFSADSDSGGSTPVLETSSDVTLKEYFVSGLELSGVGVFSPATSRPPSPSASRRILEPEVTSTLFLRDTDLDDGNVHLRRRNKTFAALEPRA